MGKKKFRPRSGGGRGHNGGGGGGYPGGDPSQRNRRRRRPMDQGRRGPGMAPGDGPPGPEGEPIPNENGEIPLEQGYGMLEMHPNGYGFLRSPENNYSRERTDPFVPGTMIEKYGLRQGLMIKGLVQQARKQTGPRLREITDVDGMPPDEYINVKPFDSLTAINPEKWYRLET